MESKVDEVMKGAINYNVAECAEMVKDFNHSGVQAAERVWRCIYNIAEDFDKKEQWIRQRSRTLLTVLLDISIEAEVCVGKFTDSASVARAFGCVNRVNSLSPK